MTGVVHYARDTEFNGVKADGQVGTSAYNDNVSSRFGSVAGTDVLGGRGHIEFSIEYYKSEGIHSGGDGAFIINSSLLGSLETKQAFGRLVYDLSEYINAFAQVSGTEARNFCASAPALFRNITLATNNASLPSATQSALSAAGATKFLFSRQIPEAEALSIDAKTRGIAMNTGITVLVFDNFKLHLFYTYGRSGTTVLNVDNINNPRLSAALDLWRRLFVSGRKGRLRRQGQTADASAGGQCIARHTLAILKRSTAPSVFNTLVWGNAHRVYIGAA